MINYYKTAKSGSGLITHEDQELNGLKFEIVVSNYEGFNYVKVEGEDTKITNWVNRVEGVLVTEQEVIDIKNTLIANAPLSQEAEKLTNDLAATQVAVDFLLMGGM